MPSFSHEALAQVFRDAPELLPELLRRAKLFELPRYDKLSAAAESLGDAVPRELRCDALLNLQSRGKSVLGLVVEVQLDEDSEKAFSWPSYVAGARHRFKCNAILVVVALNERVARWASKPIPFGIGDFRPLVLGPKDIPAVTDEATARASPEVAVVSSLAHGWDEVEQALAVAAPAAAAAHSVEGERGLRYYDLIRSGLSPAARKAFDMLPAGYQLQDEGLRKAMAEGKAKGKAESVIAFLQARGLSVTAEQREQILACSDVGELDRWLRLAATAASVDALFAH